MDHTDELIYLDNAATSFPKSPSVVRAMADFLRNQAVNPGRSGYDLSVSVGDLVAGARQRLDRFFNNPAGDAKRTVFCANATDGLNLALQGMCRPGDHVVSTVLEHNSVLRPLHELRRRGVIDFDLAPCDSRGIVDPAAIATLLRPMTRLVVMSHASNVVGTLQPVAEIGQLCRTRQVALLVDAAQTAGVVPVDMAALGADLLVFTGHKGLGGPTGIGGLLVGPDVEIESTRWGGTGVRSAQLEHLAEYPYRLEAGTINTVGIVGLLAGLDQIEERGMASILAHEQDLDRRFRTGCRSIKGLTLLGESDGRDPESQRVAVTSLRQENLDPAAAGQFLDADWNLAVRSGLHCAPLAHEALGTAPAGAVRFSFGPHNTTAHVTRALAALAHLAGEA